MMIMTKVGPQVDRGDLIHIKEPLFQIFAQVERMI